MQAHDAVQRTCKPRRPAASMLLPATLVPRSAANMLLALPCCCVGMPRPLVPPPPLPAFAAAAEPRARAPSALPLPAPVAPLLVPLERGAAVLGPAWSLPEAACCGERLEGVECVSSVAGASVVVRLLRPARHAMTVWQHIRVRQQLAPQHKTLKLTHVHTGPRLCMQRTNRTEDALK